MRGRPELKTELLMSLQTVPRLISFTVGWRVMSCAMCILAKENLLTYTLATPEDETTIFPLLDPKFKFKLILLFQTGKL